MKQEKAARIASIIVGVVFILSGLAKGIDPMGTELKISEYMSAFGMNWLTPLAAFLGIALAALELVVGGCLVMKLRISLATFTALLMTGFFAVLTLFLALFNFVADCGCFGDWIKLSNWQTFYKNVGLLLMSGFAYWKYRGTQSRQHIKAEWFMVVILSIVALTLFIYSYRNLPLFDTLPYRAGTNVPENYTVPAGAQPDRYSTELHYRNRKTGKVEVFSAEDTTWYNDALWEFVDSKSTLISKGYTPKIKDFRIFRGTTDVTDSLMNIDRLIVLILQNPEKIGSKITKRFSLTADYAEKSGLNIIALTSTSTEKSDLKTAINYAVPLYTIDATALKTMLRARNGMILFDRGVIVAKYSGSNLPDLSDININLFERAQSYAARREILPFAILLLAVLGIIILHRFLIIKQ